METLLKATELAQIMGCSERYVQKLGQTGKLLCQKALNEKKRPVLLFPLSALSPDLQRKYMAQHQVELPQAEANHSKPQAMDNFTADEREEIQFWLDTLQQWQQYREAYPRN